MRFYVSPHVLCGRVIHATLMSRLSLISSRGLRSILPSVQKIFIDIPRYSAKAFVKSESTEFSKLFFAWGTRGYTSAVADLSMRGHPALITTMSAGIFQHHARRGASICRLCSSSLEASWNGPWCASDDPEGLQLMTESRSLSPRHTIRQKHVNERHAVVWGSILYSEYDTVCG